MNDVIRATAGITGTVYSATLADAEALAAIFAGVTTGLFMVISIYHKLKKPRK